MRTVVMWKTSLQSASRLNFRYNTEESKQRISLVLVSIADVSSRQCLPTDGLTAPAKLSEPASGSWLYAKTTFISSDFSRFSVLFIAKYQTVL